MSIGDRIREIRATLPNGVRLVAVSKFHPSEAIMEAYEAGQRIFGESRVQELTDKQQNLPGDIEWHFIGHLQTNKIKYIAPFVSLIHGVDSYKLLKEIHRQATKANRILDCLLQLHIAEEETKFGFSFEECKQMLNQREWKTLSSIRICGLMGMATFTDDEQQIRKEFHSLADFYTEIKGAFFEDRPEFRELSIGMSDDYPLAIESGNTLIRVGSRIFGERT
ncbi:MAG: YggS family pyridoxal phosphate-dependent enzyme [Bacteroides sp.]|nr:YggS family pyridoxal phosphate-dependent enzyme [Bacteroides sp.]